ncbi:helicase associated domain-containing protein [Streptomyces sp. NPDC056402]|uniref:helicase associated domain-containing protein n=1 Tax=Streptomyces sp. NPDC056402 TaxID=3345810 RepID=UPI0035D6AC37
MEVTPQPPHTPRRRYIAPLTQDESAIVPGVTRHGDDIGRWLTTQRRNWDRLNEEQQRRLATLGVKKVRRSSGGFVRTSHQNCLGSSHSMSRIIAGDVTSHP